MIEYEICKLSNDHHMKVMKCSSSSQLNNNNNGNKNSKTLILIIPGLILISLALIVKLNDFFVF